MTGDEPPRDFMDLYIQEMDKQNDDVTSTFTSYLFLIYNRYQIINLSFYFLLDKQLVALVQDFFLAGSDTTTNSIGFAVLQLIHHPEIQAKLQAELDNVCGDSMPSLAHRPRCYIISTSSLNLLR